MRFYHLSPRELEALPRYLYEPLVMNLEELKAIEVSQLFTAAMLPWMKRSDRQRVMRPVERALNRISRRFKTRDRYELIEYDPEKASEFFEARGVKVVKKESEEADG